MGLEIGFGFGFATPYNVYNPLILYYTIHNLSVSKTKKKTRITDILSFKAGLQCVRAVT